MTRKYSIQDMHNWANNYEGKCLSSKYINANSKLKWCCNKGHVWESSPSSVRQGHWCLECSGSKKKNINDMHNLAKMRDGKCLSTKYINNKTKLKWQCNKGHIWEAVPSSVAKRTWCPVCSRHKPNVRKLTIGEMHSIAKKRFGQCLSATYIDASSKLKWQCEKGHIWEAKPSHVKSGSWCPVCAGWHQDISDMRKLAKARGGKCLSSKYINNRSKLQWKCKKNHIWEATPHSIKSHNWCPECGGSKKSNLTDMRKLAKARGGKCLSQTYKNARYKLKWKCSEGHTWEALPAQMKKGGWCPECSLGLGERICRVFFQQIFNYLFPKLRPKWLINDDGNQMELDGFCKSLKLAFEYQGIQHYEHVEYFQTKNQFGKRMKDDKRKQALCKEHGITLILVPEIGRYININDVKDYILNECRASGFQKIPQKIECKEIDLQEAYSPDTKEHLNNLKTIAGKKGGKCLSITYLGNNIKLAFKCEKGHIWEVKPSHVKSGSWCPVCASKNRGVARRLSIIELRSIANKRKGYCLSNKYINNKSKLKWKCEHGHIWEASVSSVLGGGWCPACAGNKKLDLLLMHEIANERGGKCLSLKYINAKSKLQWQCKYDHIWEATPDSVRSNTWCPVCVGKHQNIGDMNKLAYEKGGKCLSSKYINNRTKLKWQCQKGHIWKTTPNHIKNGTWCPICSGNKKLSIKDMKNLADVKGGKCLSKKYINANSRLSWQCEKGHTWEAIPNSIKRGSWCPICINNKLN